MNIEDKDIVQDVMLDEEIHGRFNAMMEWCERMHPYYFDKGRMVEIDGDFEPGDDNVYWKYVENSERVGEDQTTRSILKDLRKRMKYYENRLIVEKRLKDTTK
jgi:hypothetical protein